MLRNHFEVLELGVDATPAEIREAYLRLRASTHPDRLWYDPGSSSERFIAVQQAYELLSVDEQRAAHRTAVLAHRNQNRLGNGAVLTDKGWLMPRGSG